MEIGVHAFNLKQVIPIFSFAKSSRQKSQTATIKVKKATKMKLRAQVIAFKSNHIYFLVFYSILLCLKGLEATYEQFTNFCSF